MLSIQIIGMARLLKKLDKKTIRTPLEKGIRDITLWVGRLTKQSTPIDTGLLRSRVEQEIKPLYGRVFNLVEYAPFVEHGTVKFEAYHLEGGGVIGTGKGRLTAAARKPGGAFAYALGKLKSALPDHLKKIWEDINAQWKF